MGEGVGEGEGGGEEGEEDSGFRSKVGMNWSSSCSCGRVGGNEMGGELWGEGREGVGNVERAARLTI